jgi:hypothetical protein
MPRATKSPGETLPAVTQLFTEHYMVLFLLHNTIGAWWAARLKFEGRTPKAEWEQVPDRGRLPEARGAARLRIHLPAVHQGRQRRVGARRWRVPRMAESLKDFKLLDPCCGSGHFLVAAFLLLALMRMQDERLSAKNACDAVLRDNLHGLELDPRCTQIAAFALALTAWKFTEEFRPLPRLRIACSGLGVNARKEAWLELAGPDARLRWGLSRLYEIFQQGPDLGSLIDPRSAPGVGTVVAFEELQPLLRKALQSQRAQTDDDLTEIGVTAMGIVEAMMILSTTFHLVTTNVPYLTRGKHCDNLRTFADTFSNDAKSDLATIFLQRCLDFCTSGGTAALVTPQNWLFLGSYEKFRIRQLESLQWNILVRLGEHAFDSAQAAGAFAAMIVLTQELPNPERPFAGLDATEELPACQKATAVRSSGLAVSLQSEQLLNPEARVAFGSVESGSLLAEVADCYQGLRTGDSARFQRKFWEILMSASAWVPLRGASDEDNDTGGLSSILLWENGEGQLAKHAALNREHLHDMHESGNRAWGKRGIAVSPMRTMRSCPYYGEHFESNVAVIIPRHVEHSPAILAFCTSSRFNEAVRRIDQSLKVTNKTLVKVPFDLRYWEMVAATKFSDGFPKPYSDDPTQWLFIGNPVNSTSSLHVGVARLLGYQWPRQTGQAVSGAPPVLDDGLEHLVDEDGIVCIPSVRGEVPAPERLRALLNAAYGKAWNQGKLDELLSTVEYAASNLEDWLRNGFFEQHCKLFHNRPFIWQIWDGRKDGFSALVNYHKLDHKLLEKLTYTYLGDWIKKQQDAVASEESGADDRLLKAQQLQDKLKLILEGEAPYDIFVRWKPLEQQPIGWHPDLNDGVRLNIRPFVQADVLRKRPNIKWGKDRGKNPPGSPWGEERDNDRHLTVEDKRKARS